MLSTKEGALANQRAVEPIVGEKIPTALPERVFDKDMTITFGEETVLLHRVGPGHGEDRGGHSPQANEDARFRVAVIGSCVRRR